MKKVLTPLAIAALALAVSVHADETVRETTTTTRYAGTISDITPSTSTIVLRTDQSAAPVRYEFNDRTTWVDANGNTVTMESVRNHPVTVYLQRDGDQMVVTRVVASQPEQVIERKTTTTSVVPPPVVQRKTTTTTTTESVE